MVPVGPYEAHLEQDFGLRGDGTINGSVWIDVDNDGVRDSQEPGVTKGRVTISYLGPDEPAGTDIAFTVAVSGNGDYTVPGLPSGFFAVAVDQETLPEGLQVVGDGADPAVATMTLGSGAAVTAVDFRTIGDASLGGVVWNDRDGSAEVGVAGVQIDVVWNNAAGDVTLAAPTDAFGRWEIENLPPGIYRTAIDGLSLPAGMSSTTDASLPVVLAPGGSGTTDFGIALLLRVGSRAWIDRNGNGRVDEGEQGVPGVLVNMYSEIGSLVAFTETDGGGSYSFSDVLPGRYFVQLDYQSIPGDLRPTWDRDGVADLLTMVDLTEGVDVLDADFGFQVGLPFTGFDAGALARWGVLLTLFGIGLVIAADVKMGQVAEQTE